MKTVVTEKQFRKIIRDKIIKREILSESEGTQGGFWDKRLKQKIFNNFTADIKYISWSDSFDESKSRYGYGLDDKKYYWSEGGDNNWKTVSAASADGVKDSWSRRRSHPVKTSVKVGKALGRMTSYAITPSFKLANDGILGTGEPKDPQPTISSLIDSGDIKSPWEYRVASSFIQSLTASASALIQRAVDNNIKKEKAFWKKISRAEGIATVTASTEEKKGQTSKKGESESGTVDASPDSPEKPKEEEKIKKPEMTDRLGVGEEEANEDLTTVDVLFPDGNKAFGLRIPISFIEFTPSKRISGNLWSNPRTIEKINRLARTVRGDTRFTVRFGGYRGFNPKNSIFRYQSIDLKTLKSLTVEGPGLKLKEIKGTNLYKYYKVAKFIAKLLKDNKDRLDTSSSKINSNMATLRGRLNRIVDDMEDGKYDLLEVKVAGEREIKRARFSDLVAPDNIEDLERLRRALNGTLPGSKGRFSLDNLEGEIKKAKKARGKAVNSRVLEITKLLNPIIDYTALNESSITVEKVLAEIISGIYSVDVKKKD